MITKTFVILFSLIATAKLAPTGDNDLDTEVSNATEVIITPEEKVTPHEEEAIPHEEEHIRTINQTVVTNCAEIIAALKKDKKTVRDCTVGPKGHLYFRIENRLEWQDARDTCRLLKNSDLVSIHDFEEKMLLNSLALNNYFNDYYEYDQRQGSWIGLHRKEFNCDNPMEWTDGTPVDYEDYIQDEPNCAARRQEHCVYAYRRVIKHTGVVAGWNDGECDELLKSICKVIPALPTTH